MASGRTQANRSALYVANRKLAESAFLGNQVSLPYRDARPFQGTVSRIHARLDTTPLPLGTMRLIDAIGIRA